MSIEDIAQELNKSSDEIIGYLQKIWKKDKFNRYMQEREIGEENNENNFNILVFLKDNRRILIVLILLTFFVYANSLQNEFVSDDIPTILKNQEIDNFGSIFTGFGSSGIQRLIHFLSHSLAGTNPFPYRLFNVLLHTGSILVIFLLMSSLYKKRIAFFVAVLFAIHPLLSEPVIWVSGMPYTLLTFFFLLSFFFFVLSKNNFDKKIILASYLFYGLALISSEKALSLFLVFLLFELLFGNIKNNWKKLTPFVVLGLAKTILMITKINERVELVLQANNNQSQEFTSPFLQVLVAIVNYLKLIIWPQKLSLYHTEMTPSGSQYFFIVLLFLAFIAGVIYSFKKNKKVFFWLLFFLIALAPTLTPLGISWTVAERYVYLASLGIFVVIAIGIDWLIRKSEPQGEVYKKIIYGVLVVIVLSLSIRTILRNRDWKNEDTLWFATVKVSPSGANIHNNLGDVYARQGDHQKSIEEFKRAVEINPRYAEAYHNLANTYFKTNQVDLAIASYQKALEIKPDLWQSHRNLAEIYYETDNKQKALEHIEKAIDINPDDEILKQAKTVIKNQ